MKTILRQIRKGIPTRKRVASKNSYLPPSLLFIGENYVCGQQKSELI